MRVSHSFPAISATFDDPNLVSCAGLAPTMALAQRAGLADLVADTLTLKAIGGVNAHLKVPALVAGMVAGADSIDDMDVLRHGGMGRLFTGVRAPSTLGTFLRTFTFGHVRQLDAVASRFLAALAKNAPLLPGANQGCYIDIDDTIKATHGYAKQGAGYGYSGVKGLNALLAIVSTPLSAPVVAATRLRRGGTNSARGAARIVADALVHHQGLRRERVGHRSRRQRLLRTRRHRRGPTRWGPVLDHRPDEPHCRQSDLGHLRVGMDPDPLPERDLGRKRTTPGLRRRSSRGAVHRVHVPTPKRPHQRPANRAPSPAAEHQVRARRAG